MLSDALIRICADSEHLKNIGASMKVTYPERFKQTTNAIPKFTMFPSHGTLTIHFAPQHPCTRTKSQPQPYRSAGRGSVVKGDPFPAWSAVDDIKKKADAFAKEAAREFDVASQKAQAKTGHIELYSPKYYAACVFGGLLACVSIRTVSLMLSRKAICN